jgi:hypothetical protein
MVLPEVVPSPDSPAHSKGLNPQSTKDASRASEQQTSDADSAALAALIRSKQVALADLPTPPDLAQAVEDCCASLGRRRGRRERQRVEDELKLQYYFGGQHIVSFLGPKGRTVIVMEGISPDDWRRWRQQLTRVERDRYVAYIPPIWDDDPFPPMPSL